MPLGLQLIPESGKVYRALVRHRENYTGRKRTKAEALVNNICAMECKIADLDFPAFSTEDRDMVTVALTSLKNTLEEILDRATNQSNQLT